MDKYYYVDENRSRKGPMSMEELLSQDDITPETLVWCKGMEKWEKAKNIPDLAVSFSLNPSIVHSPSPEENFNIICPKCGNEFEGYKQICPNCGCPIDSMVWEEDEGENEGEGTEGKKSGCVKLSIVVIIIIILLFMWNL